MREPHDRAITSSAAPTAQVQKKSQEPPHFATRTFPLWAGAELFVFSSSILAGPRSVTVWNPPPKSTQAIPSHATNSLPAL